MIRTQRGYLRAVLLKREKEISYSVRFEIHVPHRALFFLSFERSFGVIVWLISGYPFISFLSILFYRYLKV